MIRTKADLLEYIQEDKRMQPQPSSFVKRYLGMSGAVVRWKEYYFYGDVGAYLRRQVSSSGSHARMQVI